MNLMPLLNQLRWVLTATLVVLGLGHVPAAEPVVRVLIVSGQNNHNWRETTPKLRSILENSGRFTVEVTEHPEQCDAAAFAKYDVLLSNWNAFDNPSATNWPAATRQALLDFVRQGKGFVSVHAGSSSFYDWPEYQQLAGGSWKLGQTGHGPVHEFRVKAVDETHPATRGLTNFLVTDELWHRTGLQPGVKILATAFSATDKQGSGQDEPMAFTTEFGRGRGFNLLLGHDARAMESPGFQTLLQRGTEWAATGTVKPAAGLGKPRNGVEQTQTGTAYYQQGQLLWQVTAQPDLGKPFFHPLATADGTVLTALRPADHPWHRGLWWSWKFINGINYWEEDPKTGLSAGQTKIVFYDVGQTPAGGTKIEMNLDYSPAEGQPVLKETRAIQVTAPDGVGDYVMDWSAQFTAVTNVTLDRTPTANEPDGQSWGGYAGLSLRLDPALRAGVFRNSEGKSGVAATHGQPARWMDFSGAHGGIAILDHPLNLRQPTPWYVNQGMPFFSPALLFNAPHLLRSGETLKVRYRVFIHTQPKTAAELDVAWKEFSRH